MVGKSEMGQGVRTALADDGRGGARGGLDAVELIQAVPGPEFRDDCTRAAAAAS